MPAGAIVFDRDGLHVLVVEEGVVHSRKITQVRDLGTEVEISEGVKQGDQVVLTPPSISMMAAKYRFVRPRQRNRHRAFIKGRDAW